MSVMLPSSVRESLATHSLAWNQSLTEGSASGSIEAVRYLQRRGFSLDTVERFCLGYVDAGPQELPGVEQRIAIPYLTRSGPVSMKFRCVQHQDCKTAGCAKYITWHKTGTWLFNAQTVATATGPVVLTEGELDAIAVEDLVGLPAVAYPGTNNWQDHFVRVFDGVPEVLVVADGDEPGKSAAKHVVSQLPRARVVVMPPRFDSNSFIVKYGASEYRKLLGVA